MKSSSRSNESGPAAILVEDEPALRDELAEMLLALWPELAIVGTAGDGAQAIALFERERPDIAFLDIRIPGPSGLDLARHLDGRCHVVFVTAYDMHAIDAFEQGAIDYVLKPIALDRFALTVRRLKDRLRGQDEAVHALADQLRRQAPAGASARHLRWITASAGKSVRFIAVDEILFFQSDRRYTRVVLADSEFLIRKTLRELLAELDPEQFWQTHRSTVVNALAVVAMEPDFSGRLTMRLRGRREHLPVSESFAARYRQM